MSCLNLPKKLLPAKKAWKSFTYKLQSKLHNLKNSKPINKTTRFLITLRSFHYRRLFSNKKRALGHNSLIFSHHHNNHHLNQYYHQHQAQNTFPKIYVDELYAEFQYPPPHARGEISMGDKTSYISNNTRNITNKDKAAAMAESSSSMKSSLYSMDDAWKAVVASSPQLRGVDERAEEFIYKFREDMKIQRERSMLDYQEMLARSA